MLNLKELRTKTYAEVTEVLKKTRQEVEKISKGTMVGEEKNLGKSRKLRKDVARIMTVLKEMEVKNA